MRFPPVIVNAFASKKFLAFLTSLAVLWGNRIVARLAPGFEMDPNEVALAVGTLASYIIGQGIADHGKAAAEKQVQIAAVQAMPNSVDKDAALKSLAGIAPATIQTADTVKS